LDAVTREKGFALSKKNLEKAMDSQLFKTDVNIRNGTTENHFIP
jgi:hypothetical protein